MISTPDRLGEVAAKIERGESIDFDKLAALQSLDMVHVGRQFVEAAILSHEEADNAILRAYDSAGTNPQTLGQKPNVAG